MLPLKAFASRSTNPVIVLVLESPRLYLTIDEVAEYLRVSRRTVGTLIKTKQLTYTKVRGQLRFRLSWLNDYLDKRTVKTA
jgi:excisionase family DNA binding protein